MATTPKNLSALDTPRLVIFAQEGKPRAMELLLTRYFPRVRKIVHVRMGAKLKSVLDPEDVVQNALIRVFKSLSIYAPMSEGSFRFWVAQLTEHEVIDQLRRASTKKEQLHQKAWRGDEGEISLSRLVAPDGELPSKAIERRELEHKIEEALSQLPKHHREIIVLHTLCEMTFSEVAVKMGLQSANTARQLHHRAMNKLREQFQELE